MSRTRARELWRQVGIAACVVGVVRSVAAGEPSPAPTRTEVQSRRWLATEDVRDCVALPERRWLAATAGGLVFGAGDVAERILTAREGLPDTQVERLTLTGNRVRVDTRSGSVAVSLEDHTVVQTRPPSEAPALSAQLTTSSLEGLPPGVFPRKFHQSGNTRCWATDSGLFLSWSGTPVHRWRVSGLPSGNISAVASGGDQLFIGTFDQGLFIVDREERLVPGPESGLNPNINALAWDSSNSTLWAATARGVSLCRHGARGWACSRVGQSSNMHAVIPLEHGGVVAGGDAGLEFFSAGGTRTGSFTRKQGAPFRAVWALAEGPKGTLFVGTTQGLFWSATTDFSSARAQPSAWLRRASLATGDLTDDWVTALLVQTNMVHVGTYNAGLVSFERKASHLQRVNVQAELGYVNPAGISALDGDTLAVATMDGLRVGSGKEFRTLPTLGRDVTAVLPRPQPRTLESSVARAQGEYWVASRRGLELQRLDSR
ncbi:MAG TPA: hypothetical protein VFQ61_25995 [Polyangiaceae bacterium]|nr:hypothetical protein [Polyangiaceae bacterium]